MNKLQVVMPYIGGVLSVNDYKIRGRGGAPTNATKPVVKMWMAELASKVKAFPCDGELTIELEGFFVDDRAPDLHNLHKVIGDSIKVGLGVDDKGFKFVDIGYSVGYDRPQLVLTLKGGL